eukprot:4075408-Ditylum_brightwellii.AAC.1
MVKVVNGHIPKRKRANDKNASSLTGNLTKKRHSKYCLVHSNCGHMTNKCNAIYRSDKRHKSNDMEGKTKCNSNSDEKCYHYTKEELNAIISNHAKNNINKSHCNLCDEEEANAIAWFIALEASSSDDNNDDKST